MTPSDEDMRRRIDQLLAADSDAKLNKQAGLNTAGNRTVEAIVEAAEDDIQSAGGEGWQ
jgi:hypothetical protein